MRVWLTWGGLLATPTLCTAPLLMELLLSCSKAFLRILTLVRILQFPSASPHSVLFSVLFKSKKFTKCTIHTGLTKAPTPPGRYWEMVERLKVNQFYGAPTAIRLLMKSSDDFVTKYDRY